jgi:hypothetical protein
MITLTDEQVEQVLQAAGNRWHAVRKALGINPAQPVAGTMEDNPPPQVDVEAVKKPKKRTFMKKKESTNEE